MLLAGIVQHLSIYIFSFNVGWFFLEMLLYSYLFENCKIRNIMFNFANFPPQYSIVNYFQVMKHEEELELIDYMQVNGFELIPICGLGIISRGFQVWFF